MLVSVRCLENGSGSGAGGDRALLLGRALLASVGLR
jgi:hypothetical protein